ncbi:MAG: hypothetical protein MN733_31885 [Nitrososphaera sp.]|nr:hypothetical protein [Nitrososphaera sp.]
MDKQTIRYAKAGCIAAMASSVAYAFVKLYLLGQRADLSILIINIIVFSAVGAFLIYLSKKERDLEEGRLF